MVERLQASARLTERSGRHGQHPLLSRHSTVMYSGVHVVQKGSHLRVRTSNYCHMCLSGRHNDIDSNKNST